MVEIEDKSIDGMHCLQDGRVTDCPKGKGHRIPGWIQDGDESTALEAGVD